LDLDLDNNNEDMRPQRRVRHVGATGGTGG